nr:hypothetical protein [uncultured bacterium]
MATTTTTTTETTPMVNSSLQVAHFSPGIWPILFHLRTSYFLGNSAGLMSLVESMGTGTVFLGSRCPKFAHACPFRFVADEGGGVAVVLSRTRKRFDGVPVILSAMLFAGLTTIVGFLLGFLLGQARSRMSYEEELRKVEQARVLLENQLAQMRDSPQLKSQGQTAGAGPARASE